MRLADFCNPHFKDEHPSQAWLPAVLVLENRVISRHSIRFARLTLAVGRALNHSQRESAEALTSVSAGDGQRKAPTPSAQDRFHRQPVKTEGFHSPERLPPASGPPQTLPPKPPLPTIGISTPFRSWWFPTGN
jgi:hypothetical protein